MPVNYQDFLDSATNIMANGDDSEINYRNAISRAYYAAFHACKQFEPLVNIYNDKYKNRGTHARLISALKDSGKRQLKVLGMLLDKIKATRVDADYKLNDTITKYDANNAISNTKILHRHIDKSRQALSKSQ